MHPCAEISDCLNEITSTSSNSQTRKEIEPLWIKHDNINSLFRSHRPFIYGEHLVYLDYALPDEKKQVSCDRSEEIDALIQKGLDGKNFEGCSFKGKEKSLIFKVFICQY